MENGSAAREFAALYEEVYQDMYKFAQYTLGHPQDAEDVVSEAIVDGYHSFGKLRRKESFRPWIFKILSVKCKRKLKEYVHKTTTLPEELSTDFPMDENLQIRQAFSRLTDEERLIISMHLFGGYTSKETARILHLKDATVRSKESRALQKMRTWLVY